MYIAKQKLKKSDLFISKYRYNICYSFDKPNISELKKYFFVYSNLFFIKVKKTQIIKNISMLGFFKNMNNAGYFFLCGTDSILEFLNFFFFFFIKSLKKELNFLYILRDKYNIPIKYLLKLYNKSQKLITSYKIITHIFFFFYFFPLVKQIGFFLFDFFLYKNVNKW